MSEPWTEFSNLKHTTYYWYFIEKKGFYICLEGAEGYFIAWKNVELTNNGNYLIETETERSRKKKLFFFKWTVHQEGEGGGKGMSTKKTIFCSFFFQ